MSGTMGVSQELVYDFGNGFREQAESMYGWLRHANLTPSWDNGVRDGQYRYGLTLPIDQVPALRELQRAHPARWGNHPDVVAELAKPGLNPHLSQILRNAVFVVGYWPGEEGGVVGASPPVNGQMVGVDGRGYDNIARTEPFDPKKHVHLAEMAAYGLRRMFDLPGRKTVDALVEDGASLLQAVGEAVDRIGLRVHALSDGARRVAQLLADGYAIKHGDVPKGTDGPRSGWIDHQDAGRLRVNARTVKELVNAGLPFSTYEHNMAEGWKSIVPIDRRAGIALALKLLGPDAEQPGIGNATRSPAAEPSPMNREHAEFIDRLLEETALGRGAAVTLAESLIDLAAKHRLLCISDIEKGLTATQHRARDVIEEQVRELVDGIEGIKGASILYDGRGPTVGLKFESGNWNAFGDGGRWNVPQDAAKNKALQGEAFWEPYVVAGENDFVVRLRDSGVADPDDIAGRLQELATLHTKLCEVQSMHGLSTEQEDARTNIRAEIREIVDAAEGIRGVEFGTDSRYSTVTIELASGRSNKFGGGWVVPVDQELYDSLNDGREFWASYVGNESEVPAYFVLTIEETGNAAFVDCGRDAEVARIVEDAAAKVARESSIGDVDVVLFDLNGNRVGHVDVVAQGIDDAWLKETPEVDVVRLAISLGNAALDDDNAVPEVERLLRVAAQHIRNGEHVFDLRDVNGNLVGHFEWQRERTAALEDGRIDMAAALKSGRVYMADGIEDDAFRFVVTTPDFEPGYHQGQGDAWLVDALGRTAPGYDEPQTVREVHLRELRGVEKEALKDVVEGRVTFDAYERALAGDDELKPD